MASLARPAKFPLTDRILPSHSTKAWPWPVMLIRVPSVRGEGDSLVSKLSARAGKKADAAKNPTRPMPTSRKIVPHPVLFDYGQES